VLTAGLDDQVRRVYKMLLSEPTWGLEQIAAGAALTEGEVRSALDRLTELSLLHGTTGGEGALLPVNPVVALGPAVSRAEAELDERRAVLSRDKAVLAALASEYEALAPGRSSDGVERLDGVDRVRVRLTELSQRATSEVCTLAPGGALSGAALEAAKPLDEQNLGRGVRMRTLYLNSIRNDVATVGYAKWLASRGGEIRTVPALPMRLILCDTSAAVVPLDTEDSKRGALVIHHRSVVRALKELFEFLWEPAMVLGAPETAESDEPADRDIALLKMLAAGQTDESIARKMGVSLRTVRRHVAELLRRLDAQSRFQAGVEAVRREWL
jgi:DNA-binding CsgD family transcriptional regulator